MDAVEKRIAEQLGFTLKFSDLWQRHYVSYKNSPPAANVQFATPREVALWDALLAAERRQEWIKVTPESMPPTEGRYWVIYRYKQLPPKPYVGDWHPDFGWNGLPNDCEVTHYQTITLPAAPPEEVEP